MTEEIKQVEETTTEEVAAETVVEAEENVEQLPAKRQRGRKKRVETQEVKPESEWKEQVVQIRRVTKVVKGGKKLSFRAIVIVGNKNCLYDPFSRINLGGIRIFCIFTQKFRDIQNHSTDLGIIHF